MKGVFFYLIAASLAISCGEKKESVQVDFGEFVEIPVDQIFPQGWLRELLVRQRDGLGMNREVSGHPYNTCLWNGIIPTGSSSSAVQDWWPYEQTAYLLDGLYKCGQLLQDTALIALGQENIDYVLSHVRSDDRLGPECLGDLQWAFSVFARLLMADYEVSKNPEIIRALTNHFLALPDSLTNRQTCIIESMCWTYSHTRDQRILDKAEDIWSTFSLTDHPDNEFFKYHTMAAGDSISVHGVTAAEVGKIPILLYLLTGKEAYKSAAIGFMKGVEKYHELPDGIPSSSEKLTGTSPEALHETCDISDFTWSYGYLLRATGDVKWADKIENAVFNAGLGAIGKDFKAHQYFSSPNQVFATHTSSVAPYGDEGLARQAYRAGFDVECCTGNVHRIFPNFAARMWMKDLDGGVVAALYAPAILRTGVGDDNIPVEIETITDYPFSGQIKFRIKSNQSINFPITMRIPGWADFATVTVNDENPITVNGAGFYKLERRFNSGDEIILNIPMDVRKTQTAEGQVSISRGPVLFSLLIKEDVKRITDRMKSNAEFPAYDIKPASPWNYALILSDRFDPQEIQVTTKKIIGFPWEVGNSPVTLKAKARRVPTWAGTVNTPSIPRAITTSQEVEEVELVPSGATRIRVSVFPVCK